MGAGVVTDVARGCGRRNPGSVYVECGLGPYGRPIEEFLIDPPVPVDAEALGLSALGTSIIVDPSTQIPLLFDIVGKEFYPSPADIIEEVRRLGLSRRLSGATDFSRLAPASRIVLLHAHGYLENFDEYYTAREPANGQWYAEPGFRGDQPPALPPSDPPQFRCPKDRAVHLVQANAAELRLIVDGVMTDSVGGFAKTFPEVCCASLWWEDAPRRSGDGKLNGRRRYDRQAPSFTFSALEPPTGVEPHHKLAMIASFPITNIAVTKDPHSNTADELYSSVKDGVGDMFSVTLEDA